MAPVLPPDELRLNTRALFSSGLDHTLLRDLIILCYERSLCRGTGDLCGWMLRGASLPLPVVVDAQREVGSRSVLLGLARGGAHFYRGHASVHLSPDFRKARM